VSGEPPLSLRLSLFPSPPSLPTSDVEGERRNVPVQAVVKHPHVFPMVEHRAHGLREGGREGGREEGVR